MTKPQVPNQHPYTLEPVFEELERILIIIVWIDENTGRLYIEIVQEVPSS